MIRWVSKKVKTVPATDWITMEKTEQELLDELAYQMDIQIVKQLMSKEGGCFVRVF